MSESHLSPRLLCVTAGRGPAECAQAVAHVLRAMAGEAEAAGLAFDSETEAGGFSAIASVAGRNADGFVASWLGTIQWIARSALRAGHQRKNWFVAVHELAPAATPPALVESDLRFEALRAGGPGGQHQNVTSSAVRATHCPSGLSVVAREERSQHRNRALAIERLRALLAARAARDVAQALDRQWRTRLDVRRGDPARIYEGGDFRRRDS